jgi:hypothetical protein
MDWQTEYAGWVVRGGSGWLSMLESFTEAGHRVGDKSLSELERELRRLTAVVAKQRKLRDPPAEEQ